jgi:hypothetical protein
MSEQNTAYRHPRHPVWRWMILFGFITFVLSVILLKALAPFGDAIIASHDDGSQPQHRSQTENTSAPSSMPARPSHL